MWFIFVLKYWFSFYWTFHNLNLSVLSLDQFDFNSLFIWLHQTILLISHTNTVSTHTFGYFYIDLSSVCNLFKCQEILINTWWIPCTRAVVYVDFTASMSKADQSVHNCPQEDCLKTCWFIQPERCSSKSY